MGIYEKQVHRKLDFLGMNENMKPVEKADSRPDLKAQKSGCPADSRPDLKEQKSGCPATDTTDSEGERAPLA